MNQNGRRMKCPTLLPRSRSRGVASIEALIIITFFILAWTGVEFMYRAYFAALKARSQARACAFYVATHSCDETPDYCTVSTDSTASDQNQEATQELSKSADSAEDSEHTGSAMSELNKQLEYGLFQRAEARVAASIDAPPLLGGETTDLSQSFSLPCNPKPGTMLEKIQDLFQQALGDTL